MKFSALTPASNLARGLADLPFGVVRVDSLAHADEPAAVVDEITDPPFDVVASREPALIVDGQGEGLVAPPTRFPTTVNAFWLS